ncbi:hypothetical protein KW805_04060 [Candidatus Pacearchaeota archaeon]|nr:hypothetical protein [Candidatus Pacearchaeota archaeon]
MLNIQILKTTHIFEDQARKLLPYIQKCDVFAPEIPCKLERECTEEEEKWSSLLRSSKTRSGFLRDHDDENFHLLSSEDQKTRESAKYQRILRDYLFRCRKPLYVAERWQVSRPDISIIRNPSISSPKEAYNHFKSLIDLSRRRDDNVAENLLKAEERIKTVYPAFQEKQVILLTLEIGAYHRIEDRVKGVDIIEVYKQHPHIPLASERRKELDDRIYHGASFEEVEDLILSMSNENLKLS